MAVGRFGDVTERSCSPPSHSLEQGPQAVQSASSQSRSQDCMLHGSVSVVSPQRTPPCWGVRVTLRVRSFTPPPQSALQVLHPLHISISQSMGQGKSLHVRSMVRGGQAAPPYAGWMLTLRLRSCMPTPHVTVHSPGTQSLTSQSDTSAVRSLILKISLRIFFAPQISACSCSMFPLHSFIVFTYSVVISSSCELLRRDCSSASFCFFVAAANLVCSSFSRVWGRRRVKLLSAALRKGGGHRRRLLESGCEVALHTLLGDVRLQTRHSLVEHVVRKLNL